MRKLKKLKIKLVAKQLIIIGFTFFSINLKLNAQHSEYIHVDQFGYKVTATKVAVIGNPEIGFNSDLEYSIGSTIQLRNAENDEIVFTGSPTPWNAGDIHSQSGDRGWWFDFSSFETPGNYYVYDPLNFEASAIFEISNAVYNDVLIAATKMFFYNRCYMPKNEPHVLPGYEDALSFAQDEFTRDVYDQNNTEIAKDMRGGWFDAGDYNKYVTFTESVIHDLLWAYRRNPDTFTDNFSIPESGNNIPDILDEIKWETDWLLKMSNPDGSVHIKMGSRNFNENAASPPSNNTDIRYYGPVCSSAALANASMLAHASAVFSQFPSLNAYAQTLEEAAIASWNWVLPNLISNNLDENCDDGSIVAGDADRTAAEQRKIAITAAVYLFEVTGESQYNDYLIENLLDTDVINNNQWDNYNILNIDALLHYTTLPNADPATINTILNSAENAFSTNYNNYLGFNNLDLYRAYSNDWTYHWGSNQAKSNMANLNLIFSFYDIVSPASASFDLRAEETLHYYHGVNPLDIVYLSNMANYGAENSLQEIYHGWFNDGTIWDNAETSTYGPAPGYLAGGCNQYYSANTNLTPPYGQPLQKSYLDFNTGFPDNSWELSEPAIYYQASYIRLLSGVANLNGGTVSTNDIANSKDNASFVYPNPANDSFSIFSAIPLSGKLTVYNLNGQIVKEISNYATGNLIDVQNFEKGIYLISLTLGSSNKSYTFVK
ncbi:MAG: glycoside hydrolase family 9 protein [Flavobacteriales bacterium]|nr:glycoside hydrolase family 9 protein [Flavobacteriales bacterium]